MIVLDTHIWYWWTRGEHVRLSPALWDRSGEELLPLTPEVATRAVSLTDRHRDPFDRIIIATALEWDGQLASVDGQFAGYPELADRLLN